LDELAVADEVFVCVAEPIFAAAPAGTDVGLALAAFQIQTQRQAVPESEPGAPFAASPQIQNQSQLEEGVAPPPGAFAVIEMFVFRGAS
jgi:hypothetical protein